MQKNLKHCRVWRSDLSNISPFARVGERTIVHAGVHIHDKVKIGKDCQVEAGAFIPNGVTIGDHVFIGPHVCFTNDPAMAGDRKTWQPTPTIVKKGARIGANAVIRAGLTIGEGAVIGCGSVVLEDVPAQESWAGNPARKIRAKAPRRKQQKRQKTKQEKLPPWDIGDVFG